MLVLLNDTPVDYDAAVNLMDDDIREDVHAALAPCTKQAFLNAYALAHAAEFSEEFIVN